MLDILLTILKSLQHSSLQLTANPLIEASTNDMFYIRCGKSARLWIRDVCDELFVDETSCIRNY